MILNMYSLFDIKSRIFHPPVYCHNDPHCLRMFESELRKKQSIFAEYPEDFQIFNLGTFDDATGDIIPVKKPTLVQTLSALAGETDNDEMS